MPPAPSPFDATLVLRFEAAGLIPLGKTNVPEFGLVPFAEPKLYGPARNPWQLDHSTGGSSGGSAAAVAAGIVPLAHANDGGGSIRIPASCCGLVGLKPTRGRNPLGPMLGDIFGGLVRRARGEPQRAPDTAAALDATAGPEIGDPYAAPPSPGSYLAAVQKEAEEAPHRLCDKKAGRRGVRCRVQGGDRSCRDTLREARASCRGRFFFRSSVPGDIGANFSAIWASGLTMLVDFIAKATGKTPAREEFEGLTWGLYQLGKTITAAQYQLCWLNLQGLSRRVAAWQQSYDAWITPVLATPPMRIGTLNFEETDLINR